MSEFFKNLINTSCVEEPKDGDKYKFDNVYSNLEEISKIVRTGVYQIFGLRSDKSDPNEEELLYVGKTKTRDVGIRVHEQLNDRNRTFRKNIYDSGYSFFCEQRNIYDILKDKVKAVYVTRVEILVFPHSLKGEAGRDITEILLINSREKHPIFNIEFTDSTPKERLKEEEKKSLFEHTEYSGMSREEMKLEGVYEIDPD